MVEIAEVDELFDALVQNEHIPDDIKRKLYFLQSDQELVNEIYNKYETSEIFLTVRIILLMNIHNRTK